MLFSFAKLKTTIISFVVSNNTRKVEVRIAIGLVGLIILEAGIFVGSFLGTKELIEVRTNSPEISVSFKGNDIAISPSKIWLDNVTAGSSVEQCIYVANKGGKDVELVPFASPEQWVSFENDRINIAAGSRVRLCVRIDVPENTSGQTFEILVGVKPVDGNVNVATCAKLFLSVQ